MSDRHSKTFPPHSLSGGERLSANWEVQDGDQLIFSAVNGAMKQTYAPFDRSLHDWLEDVEIFTMNNPSRNSLPTNIRTQMALLGSMIASRGMLGFSAQGAIDSAKTRIAEKLMQAAEHFKEYPNLMPPLDEAQASGIADQIESNITRKISMVRQAVSGKGAER
jgi:hypothetical protein